MTRGPLVAVLAYDNLCTFEFGIACEIFGLSRPEMGHDWYQFMVCGTGEGPFEMSGGLRVVADRGLDALKEADLIIVPGWQSITTHVPDQVINAVSDAHARGARIASLCSGIVVLGETGLLDGKRVTTHWRYADDVRARFPNIEVDQNVLYVDHGSIFTAAGSAAGIDLCLHIVRKDFGAEAANKVARRLVVPPHREGGQAQYVEAPLKLARTGKDFGALLDALREDIAQTHSVSSMAKRAGMSLRSFQRMFAASTGLSPSEWLVAERIRLAQDMLEMGQTTIDDISLACGFGSVETMRHHFRKRLNTSPNAYRQRFSRLKTA